jgi:Hemolysins and related proteins containing CBS domains
MNDLSLIITYSIVFLILLILSAIFSSADMAYGSVSELRLENYLSLHKKSRSAKYAIKFVKEYDFTISIILFLNDVVNIGSETIAALLGYTFFTYNNLGSGQTGSLISSLIAIFAIILFGEIAPKSLTKNHALGASLAYAKFFNILYYMFYPIAFIVTKMSDGMIKKLAKKNKKIQVTDEELEEMVNVIEKEGVIDKDNAEILRSTLDYASTEAYEIMTPRVDVYAINIEDSIDEILKDERTFVHSRIPVYRDTIDNIIGYVRTKDLIRIKLSGLNESLESVLKGMLRFPRSTEINDILQDFKRKKTHIALILDEYGGVEGIITMEDILEEIVGEIWDEVDNVDEPYIVIGKNKFIVDGSMNLNNFFELVGIDSDSIDTEYVTIGGYCIELLDDRFAKVGDIINFKNIRIKVLKLDNTNTIEKIEVKVKRRVN